MAKNNDPESRRIKLALLTASTMAVLGGPFLSPALPAIQAHFVDVANIDLLARLVLTLPALFIAANAPVAGYIVDRFGRINVLVTSLILAGVAGTSGYFAPTITALLVSRAILGLAVGGIMISTSTLIADYYSGLERAKFFGLQTGLFGLGGSVLVILAGILADNYWKSPFLIYPLALGAVPLVLLALYEPRPEFRCADDPPPIGEPGACAGEAIHKAARTPSPAANDKAAPTRLIAFIYLMVLLAQIVVQVIPAQLPFYLKELSNATAVQSGLAIASFALSFALASIFLGKMMARRDHASVIMLAFIIMGLGLSLVSLAGNTPLLYLGLVSTGGGAGMLMPHLFVWLANETPAAMRGRVLGGFTTSVFLGQFLSPLLSQPMVRLTDIKTTILLAGGFVFLLVPFLLIGRKRLQVLTAEPVS